MLVFDDISSLVSSLLVPEADPPVGRDGPPPGHGAPTGAPIPGAVPEGGGDPSAGDAEPVVIPSIETGDASDGGGHR